MKYCVSRNCIKQKECEKHFINNNTNGQTFSQDDFIKCCEEEQTNEQRGTSKNI